MHIFSSCILITTFAVLVPSFANPSPKAQDPPLLPLCLDLGDIPFTVDRFFLNATATATTPTFALGFITSGGLDKIALDQNILEFRLNNNDLSTDKGFVTGPNDELIISSAPSGDIKFFIQQHCVVDKLVPYLQAYRMVNGNTLVVQFVVYSFEAGNVVLVQNPTGGPSGKQEISLQVVPVPV